MAPFTREREKKTPRRERHEPSPQPIFDFNETMTECQRLDVDATHFSEPVKRIFDSQGTQDFQSSVAMLRLSSYLHRYVQMVQGQRIPSDTQHPQVAAFAQLLDKLSELVDSTPALAGPRRYGNLACRDWHAKIDAQLPQLLNQFVPARWRASVVELQYYLGNAFGSSERLDYGTGHELSFFAVVCALDMLGAWGDAFSGPDLLYVFDRYYALVRKLIRTYTLEPAGSHGVWGLDDHFHLVYILGSSQWADDRTAPIMPQDLQNKHAAEDYAATNFYCQAIAFVFKVKSGPFAEHSPMLYDICRTVPTWSKVQRGLLRMYLVEVLNKFPVVQHFWFGTGLFPWTSAANGATLPTYEAGQDSATTTTASTNATAELPTTTTFMPYSSSSSSTTVPVARMSMAPPNARHVSRFMAHDRLRRAPPHPDR